MKSMQLCAPGVNGESLTVEFRWMKDRFAHCVYLKSRGKQAALLASLEGPDTELWPASPPIQQLSSHSEDATCLLGVGMAGKSHWSMSVKVTSNPLRVIWDVACRVAQPPTWIGSRYQPQCGFESDRNAGALLLPESLPSVEITTLAGDAVQSGTHDSQIQVAPRTSCLALPATIRWSYQASVP